MTKIKPFICKYEWKGINFPSEKKRLIIKIWEKYCKNCSKCFAC